MMSRSIRIALTRLSLCLALALSVGVPAVAQAQTGAIAGQVSDETGGALRGAIVSIKKADTGVVRTATTDENGRYEVASLAPGAYDVSVTMSGFSPASRAGVTVASGPTTVDLVMGVALSDGTTVLGEVTTATKIPTAGLLIPASISSVPSTLLAEQNATTLQDGLNNVAGATMHRDAGAIEMFFLRGFDSTANGLLLADGAYEPRTGINQVYNVDRLEVVRGPIGFLYGGNALAGAVNMVRKRPVGNSFQRVSFIGGSYSSVYGTADVNQSSADGKKALRVNAMWNSSDNYRDDKEGSVWAFNPSFTLSGERTSVNVDFEMQSTEGSNDGGIPIVLNQMPDVPRTRSYQSPFDEFTQDTTRVRVNLNHTFTPTMTLTNKTYYTTQDWANEGTLLLGTIPNFTGGGTVLRLFGNLGQDVTVFGNQLDLMVKGKTGGVSHELVAGLEYQDLQVDAAIELGALPPIDLLNPIETATLPIFYIPGAGSTLDLDTQIIAPYVLDSMAFSEQWRVSVGGRVDFLDQKNAVTGFAQTESAFSPFVGVLFAPNPGMSVYGNYGKVLNPISLAVASGDPEPEIGEGFEFGFKNSAMGGRLRTSVAAYRLQKDNISIIDQTGLVAQLGDQESKGLEIEVGADAGSGVNLLFVYGYTDSVLTRFTQLDPLTNTIADRSGNTPAWVPSHVFNSWITKRFTNGLLVGGGLRYVSERFMNEANDYEVPGYATVDGNISYRRGRWEATLHLKNLTDTEYETRSVNQVAVIPAPGFNVAAGLNLRF